MGFVVAVTGAIILLALYRAVAGPARAARLAKTVWERSDGEGDDQMDVEERAREYLGTPPTPTEDEVTKTIERYTAMVPSSALLAVALGAMGLSLMGQLGGRGKWGNFIAQWVPTLLIMGVYNKLVKIAGHDQQDRGAVRGQQASGISNRSIAEERVAQSHVPPRGQSSGTRVVG